MPKNEKIYRVQIESELEELIPGFMKNRHLDIAKIKTMLQANDFEAIKLVGHTMKGNGAGYGFNRISEIGRLIEETAKTEKGPGIEQLILDLSDFLKYVEVEYI